MTNLVLTIEERCHPNTEMEAGQEKRITKTMTGKTKRGKQKKSEVQLWRG